MPRRELCGSGSRKASKPFVLRAITMHTHLMQERRGGSPEYLWQQVAWESCGTLGGPSLAGSRQKDRSPRALLVGTRSSPKGKASLLKSRQNSQDQCQISVGVGSKGCGNGFQVTNVSHSPPIKKKKMRAPGWLGRFSIRLLILAQVMISWFVTLRADGTRPAWESLSLSLSQK